MRLCNPCRCGARLFAAVIWWESSPNYNNANNFCDVNTNGSADNNNANNSFALAPDFKELGLEAISELRELQR